MNYDDFLASLEQETPPLSIGSAPLQALWYDAKAQWDLAHELVQNETSSQAAWVHAYLHRKEGDLGNARYWYGQAGRAAARCPLEEEWEQIVQALLDAGSS